MDGRSNTHIAAIDFETYSAAGYVFRAGRWRSISKSPPHGLGRVGAAAYAEHPSTRLLSLAYRMPDGPRLWTPNMPPPEDLHAHIAGGGLVEAWNAFFEAMVWHYVCHARLGWPPLPIAQLRDAMAKSRAYCLPGSLASAGRVLAIDAAKLDDGKRLIKKFSIPRNPTKHDPRLRIRPADDTADAGNLYKYNLRDIEAEEEISSRLPDLSAFELRVYLADQAINTRGVAIDLAGLAACKATIENATHNLTARLQSITSGAVRTHGELKALGAWLAAMGHPLSDLQKQTIADALAGPLPPVVAEALRIRQILSQSSVQKLYAIADRLSGDGRLRGLFAYAGAERTGRWAGRGPQPHNLPGSGPPVCRCDGCNRYYGAGLPACPHCGGSGQSAKWCAEAALTAIHAGRAAEIFADPFGAVSGCLRALYVAGPGCELISSDYSSIEAVVLAVLAGERWRIDAFRRSEDIYQLTADQIGLPTRKQGKVAELASGYQGSVGAWRQFGAEGEDEEILGRVRAWRRANRCIVAMWYRTEDQFRAAIQAPGRTFGPYTYTGGSIRCLLPSGRLLYYHQPHITDNGSVAFFGNNSDYTKGPLGWIRIETYGGKLVENYVQATARDILAHAIVLCEANGYPVVLHVHDEIVCELPKGAGSVAGLESLMMLLPPWAAAWPVRASGGWCGHRFKKD